MSYHSVLFTVSQLRLSRRNLRGEGGLPSVSVSSIRFFLFLPIVSTDFHDISSVVHVGVGLD